MIDKYITIINLFFVPFISLSIFNHKKYGEKTIYELIVQYCVLVAIVTTLSKASAAILRYLFNLNIAVTSSLYSILAITIACVLPYVVNTFKFKLIASKKNKQTNENTTKNQTKEEILKNDNQETKDI